MNECITPNTDINYSKDFVGLEKTPKKRAVKKNYIHFDKFYLPFIKIFIPSFAYAFLRHTINHDEPWYDIPFYLLNKVLGVTSVIIMSLAYVIGPIAKHSAKFKAYLGHRKYFGVGGFFLGTIHGLMSLLLMTPNNYKIFYNLETGRLNWQGNLSMFFGTIALFHLSFLAITSVPVIIKGMHSKQWKEIQRSRIIALWITFAHIATFGYKSWLNLDKWYGGMPPFSLIGASSIALILIFRKIIMSKNNKESNNLNTFLENEIKGY